jgi:hypothetical protein
MIPRTLRRPRTAVIGIVAIGVAAAAVLAHPSASHAAQPPAAMTNGFQDHTSNDYLRIQLDPTAANYGGFVVAIPGTGLTWAAQPAAASTKSDHSVQLRYDGTGYLDANAKLDTEFGVGYQTVGAPTTITLRLIGQVDPAHTSGSIELWVNGIHYQFAAAPAPQNADTVGNAVLAALKANDWTALYNLADDSLRGGGTAAQFTQQVQAQFGAGGQVSDAHSIGATTYTTNQAGVSYANLPVSITVIHAGATQTATGTLVLIDDQGSWRWFTMKPASS